MDIHTPRTNPAERPDEQAARQAESEARAYVLSTAPGEHLRPRDLQAVTKGALGFNAACRVLERLQVDGELVRLGSGEGLTWRRSKPATPPGPGYALPLSPREHGALLRLLDEGLAYWTGRSMSINLQKGDGDLLRAIRGKLKRPA